MKYLLCLFILTIAGEGFSQAIDYGRLGMDVEGHRTPVGLQVGGQSSFYSRISSGWNRSLAERFAC